MAKSYADITVERATTFLNKLNAHCDTAKTGDYLVKFALIDGFNLRTVIFDHLLPTGKYGLLHFSLNPLKVWHSMTFKLKSDNKQTHDRQYRVGIDVDRFHVTTSKDWRKPKVMELRQCFFDCLASIARRGLKDDSRIQPDKFRFLLHLGGLRLPPKLIKVFKPIIKKAKSSIADSTALQEVYDNYFTINHILSTQSAWIVLTELIETEDLAFGLPCLCKVSTFKRDVTDPKLSEELGNDKEFQQLPNHQVIAVNNQGEWRKMTPQDFIKYVSSLLYYLS